MVSVKSLAPFVAAMAIVVAASNVLVQFPVQGTLGALALADILTWGAFTYPFAFLVTDLANRRYGPTVARRIVFDGGHFVSTVDGHYAVGEIVKREAR